MVLYAENNTRCTHIEPKAVTASEWNRDLQDRVRWEPFFDYGVKHMYSPFYKKNQEQT